MIPAAGFGTRLGELTFHTPKALVEIGGTTMLERACTHLVEAGFKRIAINTHYLAQQIHQFVPKLREKFPNIQFHLSHEPEILDIGGGMKKVARDLKLTEMLVFNADALLLNPINPLEPILKAWDAGNMDALMYLKHKSNLHHRPQKADFNLTKDGRLARLADNNNHEYLYPGISIYRTDPLLSIKDDKFHIMTDYIFPKMQLEHNFYGLILDAGYMDIGTPESLSAAKDIIKTQYTV